MHTHMRMNPSFWWKSQVCSCSTNCLTILVPQKTHTLYLPSLAQHPYHHQPSTAATTAAMHSRVLLGAQAQIGGCPSRSSDARVTRMRSLNTTLQNTNDRLRTQLELKHRVRSTIWHVFHWQAGHTSCVVSQQAYMTCLHAITDALMY